MYIYKLSQISTDPTDLSDLNKKAKAYDSIISLLPGYRFRSDRSKLNDYVEETFTSLYGEAYIQIRYDNNNPTPQLAVEIYFDRESAANEYNKTLFVPLNIKNPAETLNNVKTTITKLKSAV